jgi:hypothetical protein
VIIVPEIVVVVEVVVVVVEVVVVVVVEVVEVEVVVVVVVGTAMFCVACFIAYFYYLNCRKLSSGLIFFVTVR